MFGHLTRSRFLRAAGGALLALAAPGTARAANGRARARLGLAARNAGRRYAGDRALFATVSPGVPGRDAAVIRFALSRAATVKLEAVRTAKRQTSVAWETKSRLRPGTHELTWKPDPATAVGSYVMRFTISRPHSAKIVLGDRRPASVSRQLAAVVRVLGVEAASPSGV